MDYLALLDALFGAETMPDDARDRLAGGFEAYELDTSSAAAKVVELETALAAAQAEISALKVYNFDKLMNGDIGGNPEGGDDDDETAITVDDLFGDPDDHDTNTKEDD